MHQIAGAGEIETSVSVPFNAGRGLMHSQNTSIVWDYASFSTLQCGSWIDAPKRRLLQARELAVSVPFNAGRGLMLAAMAHVISVVLRFSTLQCGSWIDADGVIRIPNQIHSFSTLQCGSWIDAAGM